MIYRVTDYYDPIGEKKLPSKCPDCGNSNCLELRFYQKRIVTPYSKKVTKKVTGVLYCNNTHTEISPVLWTDDIENQFKTEKTKLHLNPTSLKFNIWFYTLLILPIILVLCGIAYSIWDHNQYIDQSIAIKKTTKGDKVKVIQTLMNNGAVKQQGNTWYLVVAINADTLVLKQHKDFSSEDGFDFELENNNFTGETIKVSYTRFKERSVMGFDYTDMKFSGYVTEFKKEE